MLSTNITARLQDKRSQDAQIEFPNMAFARLQNFFLDLKILRNPVTGFQFASY